MAKKILLVNTPFYRLMGSHYNGMSLGLGYIAAVLNAHGHETWIYNADYKEDDSAILNMRDIFAGYTSYKTIMADPCHPVWEETTEQILSQDPDIVGFSMYTANFRSVRLLAAKIKQRRPQTFVVVGGDHPTIDLEDTIQATEFDAVVRGEGEFTLLELAEGKPLSTIQGLAYRDDRGNPVINPPRAFIRDLDSLPFPEREHYLPYLSGKEAAYMLTGRGCPHTCTYCTSPKKWGRRATRLRSPENVIQELQYIQSKFLAPLPQQNQPMVYFVDDTFTLKPSRIIALLTQMIEANLGLQWKCDTRADCITPEIAQLMQWAGCVRAKIGVESGSERILREIRKGETKEEIRRGIGYLKQAGVPVTAYLMVGFPGETDEDVRHTIAFAKELSVDYYSISVLAPYFGTEIYHRILKEGKIHLDKEHWEYFYHQSGDMILNDGINPRLLDDLFALNEMNSKKWA